MFGVLDASLQEQLAKEICKDYRTCPCVMDSFSQWHMDEHMDKGGLLGNLSVEELKVIAAQLDTDISTTECQQASNRRAVESKSLHTHQMKLSEASSQYVSRSLRTSAAVGFHGFKHVPTKAGWFRMKPGPKAKQRESRRIQRFWRTSRLVRGAGAWAVFLSKQKFSVRPCTPEGAEIMKQLSQEYKSLTPEQLAPLQDEAFKARQASKFGNKGLIRKTKRKALGKRKRTQQTMLADDSGNAAAIAIADVDRPQCSDLLPVRHGNRKAPKVAASGHSMELDQVLRQGQLANMEASQHKLAEAEVQRNVIKAAATHMESVSPLVAALKDNSPDFPTAYQDFINRDGGDGSSNFAFKPAAASTLPIPITPAVPGARSLLAADVSSASMFSAWNSLLSNNEELCWQSTINLNVTDSKNHQSMNEALLPLPLFLLPLCCFIHSLGLGPSSAAVLQLYTVIYILIVSVHHILNTYNVPNFFYSQVEHLELA